MYKLTNSALKSSYRWAAGNIRRHIIPCCRGAVSERVLGADQPAPRQFEAACLCGAGGAVGDCRTCHEHRSYGWGSELLGQELVHFDGILHLHQPLHPLPSQSLECRADPVRPSCPRHYSGGKVNGLLNSGKLSFVGSTPDRETVDDVWKHMNVYQFL